MLNKQSLHYAACEYLAAERATTIVNILCKIPTAYKVRLLLLEPVLYGTQSGECSHCC